MAEPLKPSQIIQQQIDALRSSAPPPITQAERDQIMKGRKGQADIDAGRAAIKAREDTIKAHNDQINTLLAKQVEEVTRETSQATQAEREANANPLLNTIVPAGIGAAGGAAIGEVGNRILHNVNSGNARAIVEIGNELGPSENWTNSQINRSRMAGAAAAAEKYAPSTTMGRLGGVAGRLATYGVPAGVFLNEYGKYEERATDPNATEADRMANQRVANGLLGVATGIAADGGMRFAFPSRHEGEGQAMARIQAAREYAQRMDAADAQRASNPLLRQAPQPTQPPTIDITPEPPAPKALAAPAAAEVPSQAADPIQGSKAYLQKRASELGLSKQGTKADLLERISAKEATFAKRRVRAPKATSLVAPIIGAGVAADAAYNSARAEGSSPLQAGAEAAGTGAAVGGAVGGAGYGINRLLQAAPTVGRAIGGAAAALAPMAASDMTDYSPEELAMARNWVVRNAPALAIGPAMEDAYVAATVPERRPADPFEENLSRFETFMAGNR